MNNYLTHTIPAAVLSALFLISSCSSSSDSTAPAAPTAPTVPANAILIDSSATAEATMTSAVGTGILIASAFGVETAPAITAKDIINNILERANINGHSSVSLVTGVDLTSEFCPSGGTASGDETETATSYTANITFNNCTDGEISLTGNLAINATFTATDDGPYTANLSGDLTISFSGETIGFNGFNYAENGNDGTGDYTITSFTYAINPSAGGGFLVELTQALVGNTNLSCELSSGQILLSGAAGSQARATINIDGSATVEYHSGDGNFIETDNSPFPCLS